MSFSPNSDPAKNPQRLRRAMTVFTVAGLMVAGGCSGDNMSSERNTSDISITCGGENVVVMGPYTPGVDEDEQRVVVSNKAKGPEMVPLEGRRQADRDDFVFIAACETGKIAIGGIRTTNSADAGKKVSFDTSYDARLRVVTKDEHGTVELEKTEGHLSQESVRATYGENDSLAYIVFNDSDEIVTATVGLPEQEPVSLVG